MNSGIHIFSPDNTIGGTTPAARNVVAGNFGAGIKVEVSAFRAGLPGNVVQGNYIGLTAAGGPTLGNRGDGIQSDAQGLVIGGGAPGAGNVISGNFANGVNLVGGAALVQGNLIGTDASGTVAVGNRQDGLFVDASGTTIGGTGAGERNLISGNFGNGVNLGILGAGSLLKGNLIGTDISGTRPLGNVFNGIFINSGLRLAPPAIGNTIGGVEAGAGNVISGNSLAGISIQGDVSQGNLVEGNLIGTDATGQSAVPNSQQGIAIGSGANNDTIGGSVTGAGNIISGNGLDGVSISGAGTSHILVQGNSVGTDRAGRAAVPNQTNGIVVRDGATIITIGGPGDTGNLISGNGQTGIALLGPNGGSTGDNTLVTGNRIGTDRAGMAPLGNGQLVANAGQGISINDELGTMILENVVSGNRAAGIALVGGTSRITLQGNLVGLNRLGTAALGNIGDGITISDAASVTIGGTGPGAGNVISGNAAAGIDLTGTSTSVMVQGNLIGTDAGGHAALGNAIGVFIDDAVGNTIGGTTPATRNVISGNTSIGIQVFRIGPRPSDPSVPDGNAVEGNFIGTDAGGTRSLANGFGNTADGAGIGVFLNNARSNLIRGNVISGNRFAGISIFGQAGVASTDNQIVDNRIGPAVDRSPLSGTDPATTPPSSSNRQNLGVVINSSLGNTIGGTTANANQIEDNIVGVEITGLVTNPQAVDKVLGNVIASNFIGIYINQAANNLIMNNTITGNASTGITLLGTQTTNNVVQGNTIVANIQGSLRKATNGTGVYIESARNNQIRDNQIARNGLAGVYLFNRASGNVVAGNTIVTNGSYGVFLYNSGGNVDQVSRKGKNANHFSGNFIADFREFTGAVRPRLGQSTHQAAKGRQVRGRHVSPRSSAPASAASPA